MRLAIHWMAMGLLATGLGLPQAASALSLADLLAGASVSSLDGDLTFDDFTVKKNKFKHNDLDAIEVVSIDDGFALEFSSSTHSKITFEYSVTANSGEIIEAALTLDGPTKSKASAALDALAELSVKGGETDSADLGPVAGLGVTEVLNVKKGEASLAHVFDLTAVAAPATTTPEKVPAPAALLLLAPAAALLARRTRREA